MFTVAGSPVPFHIVENRHPIAVAAIHTLKLTIGTLLVSKHCDIDIIKYVNVFSKLYCFFKHY